MATFFVLFYLALPDFFPFSVYLKHQPGARLLDACRERFPTICGRSTSWTRPCTSA